MKNYLIIAALISSTAHADFNLMSDDDICRQYGERCPQQINQSVQNAQDNYPSFYGSGPVRQYVPPQPYGSFTPGYSKNNLLVQVYDQSCNCVRLIGLIQ